MEESFDLDDTFCDPDDLQSFMKHLRKTLVFIPKSAIRESFHFYVSRKF